MAEKTIKNGRIINKHDTEANWNKATGFIPYQGEVIVYDADEYYSYERFKIGDGVTVVTDLPFSSQQQADWNQNDINAVDYVKNRTHWAEEEYEEILTLDNQAFYNYMVETEGWAPHDTLINDNVEYTIIVDGQSYTCTSYFDGANATTILGNSTLQYPDTTPVYDVPFLIEHYATDEQPWMIAYSVSTFHADGQTNHKFEIKKKTGNTTIHPLDEKFIPDTIARTADVQPKNLIVKYQEGSTTTVTHNSIQIADAADAGVEVKFFDGLEYLSLLEYSREQYFAVFYTDYYDSSNILNIKYVLIDNTNNVMMADTSKHNVAFKTDLDKKQDKITGSSGQYAKFNSNGKLVGAALDLTEAKEYTDTKIADLVNSAPETLDTLGELAAAFADNQDMVQTLNDAITNKADKADVLPADWNQNDENAADYVKNRTHWVNGETVHQLDEKFIPDTIARTEHIHNNYGVCSTDASTAAKTVQIDGFELREGAVVYVKFTNSNSASNPTLNVNSKGAKAIYYRDAAITDGVIKAGDIATFIYSTNYHLISIDSSASSVGVITDEEIDEICGGSIQYAEDVMF